MKRPDGVVVIAIYHMLIALAFLIGSCAILIAMFTVAGAITDTVGVAWSIFGMGIGLLFCLIFLVGSALAAWGLLALRNWGRWVAIVLAVLQLVGFPIFTIIGGVIIYYLLRDDVKAAFEGMPPLTQPAPVSVAPEPAPAPTAGESLDRPTDQA